MVYCFLNIYNKHSIRTKPIIICAVLILNRKGERLIYKKINKTIYNNNNNNNNNNNLMTCILISFVRNLLS